MVYFSIIMVVYFSIIIYRLESVVMMFCQISNCRRISQILFLAAQMLVWMLLTMVMSSWKLRK